MSKKPEAGLWIKLTLGGAGRIGPGKIELLRRIGEHQSIAAAARSMDMSYRRAWLLVDELNRLFTQPVVAKWQGGRSQGGASITPFGSRLIAAYDEMMQRAHQVNADLLAELAAGADRGPLDTSKRAERAERTKGTKDRAGEKGPTSAKTARSGQSTRRSIRTGR